MTKRGLSRDTAFHKERQNDAKLFARTLYKNNKQTFFDRRLRSNKSPREQLSASTALPLPHSNVELPYKSPVETKKTNCDTAVVSSLDDSLSSGSKAL